MAVSGVMYALLLFKEASIAYSQPSGHGAFARLRRVICTLIGKWMSVRVIVPTHSANFRIAGSNCDYPNERWRMPPTSGDEECPIVG
jgi:hypothetical protein